MGYLLLLLVSLLTCAGQLCQKQAVEHWQQWPDDTQRLARTLRWLLLAIVLMGIGMLLWLNVLQRLPLSLAYPMLSINFVLVSLAAQWLYGERTTPRYWCGVAAIMLGVLLMGMSQ